MTVITNVKHQPGRVWGVLSLIAVAVPLPFLFALTVLSAVVQRQVTVPGSPSAEEWAYGVLAFGGLLFFPALFFIGLALAIRAVRMPRPAAKAMGWIAIGVVILAIPVLWFAYGVWIFGH